VRERIARAHDSPAPILLQQRHRHLQLERPIGSGIVRAANHDWLPGDHDDTLFNLDLANDWWNGFPAVVSEPL
jgi:hypothetical protein